MSRYYGMHVRVQGHLPDRVDAIRKAADEEWDFDEWHEVENELSAYAESKLCGGETEEEFARRLARAIWEANEQFCQIEVQATYLEALPHEDYCFDEEHYQSLMNERLET